MPGEATVEVTLCWESAATLARGYDDYSAELRLCVGLYDLGTGRRLPGRDAQGIAGLGDGDGAGGARRGWWARQTGGGVTWVKRTA